MPRTKTPLSQHVASPRQTPQSQPIPGSTQVANSAGGFSWAVDNWKKLDRFLILGTEGGSYYATEQKLTQQNAANVTECIKLDGVRTVKRITEVSQEGRAFKNDPAIFCLALATIYGNPDTKKAAYAAIPEVCRIPTHLFHFAQYVNDLRGWGSGLKKAVARWYTMQDAEKLAYAVIKYQQRDGWSNADLLRLSHAKPPTAAHGAIFRWITSGIAGLNPRTVTRRRGTVETTKKYPSVKKALPPLISEFSDLSEKSTTGDVLPLIEKYNLPHEAIPTHLKTDPKIWEAILQRGMPLTAMIRNLANMTRIGTLGPLGANNEIVLNALSSQELLKKARIHPLAVLMALKTYSAGKGQKGTNTWTPVQQIVDALDKAFYLSFKFVEPTGKNILLGLDVSGSMGWGNCAGAEGLTPREGTAVMAMVTAAVEKNYHVLGFSHTLVPIGISPKMRLDKVIQTMESVPMGGTDCALPMKWALQNKAKVDLFSVYTDNETWAGRDMHPSQALRKYREQVNPNARLAVIGMASNGFTIADPNDSGMMDLVGFDANAPALLSEFALGRV